MRVELFGNAIAAVSETGAEFHRSQPGQEASLTVIPGGGVVFTFIAGAERTSPASPPPAEEPDQAGQTPQAQPLTVESPRAPQPVSPEPSPTLPQTPSPADTDAKPEEAPRVQLTGRLGRDPNFRTSPRGTLVDRFPLAVHAEDGTTSWHTVLAFGDRAQQLQ